MPLWLSRWFTKSIPLSKVDLSICVDGDVAGTLAESSVIVWLKTCSAIEILGTSSGSFVFRETFPALMALLMSLK